MRMSATAASVVGVGALTPAAVPAAARLRRPALAAPPAPRHTSLQHLPAVSRKAGPRVVCAATASTALAAPAVLAGAAALGLTQPALFSGAAPTYLAGAAAGAALLCGLHLEFKKSAVLTMLGLMAAALAAPLLAHAALAGLPPQLPDVLGPLLASAAQVVLLPLLAGAALSSAAPQLAASPAPLRSALALALLVPVCGGVVARGAQLALAASPLSLLGAVLAAQAGTTLLAYASSRLLGLPNLTSPLAAGALVGALGSVLAAAHFAAQPLVAVACVGSAVLSALLACSPAGASSADAATSAGLASSWQVPPDTYINAWRSRQGLPVGGSAGKATSGAAPPANGGVGLPADTYINAWRSRQGTEGPDGAPAPPSVPSNVAQARAWIHNWRSKQGQA